MNNGRGRERAIWIGVVAVLATSLLWLTVFVAIAMAGTHVVPVTSAIALFKALARVCILIVSRTWRALPLLALGGIMLALTLRAPSTAKREARHA